MATEFDPRRAEPGTEFSYTTTTREKLDDGEDLPEGARLEVDTDEEGKVTARYAIREGVQKTFRAGDDGVVWPKNAEEDRALSTFDLPVARTAQREAKAAEAPKAAEAEKGGK